MNWELVVMVALVTVATNAAYFFGRAAGWKHGYFRGVTDENARMRGVVKRVWAIEFRGD